MTSEVALPDSIEVPHALTRQKDEDAKRKSEVIDSLAADNKSLGEDTEQLKRYIYGQRSERSLPDDDSQLTLFDQEPDAAQETANDGAAAIAVAPAVATKCW
jgi:hypothetical protein